MARKITALLFFIIICLLLQKFFSSLNPGINILTAAVIAVCFINPRLKVFLVAGLGISADLFFGTPGYYLLTLSVVAAVASLSSRYFVWSNNLSLLISIIINLLIAWLVGYLFNLIFRGLADEFFSIRLLVLKAGFWFYYLLFNSLLVWLAISWSRKWRGKQHDIS